jgi:hypothetical protein
MQTVAIGALHDQVVNRIERLRVADDGQVLAADVA